MDEQRHQASRAQHEEKHQKPVIGAAALGHRNDGEPGGARLRGHARIHQRLDGGGHRINHHPGRMPASTHSPASPSMAASDQRSTSWACAAAGERGRPRKTVP